MSIPNSPQITTLRLPNGTEVEFVDWQDQPIYSTADLLNGWSDEQVPLFTYSIGDPVSATSNVAQRRIATKRDTNVSTSGSAAGTEELMIYAIKPEVLALSTDPEDEDDLTTMEPRLLGQPIPQANQLALLNWYSTLRLYVSQKIMHEAGFGYYNPGFGASAMGSYGGGSLVSAQRTLGVQGLPSQGAVRSFAIPIHVGSTEKYRVEITNPTAATIEWLDENDSPAPAAITGLVLSVRVNLDGLYKRPVA